MYLIPSFLLDNVYLIPSILLDNVYLILSILLDNGLCIVCLILSLLLERDAGGALAKLQKGVARPHGRYNCRHHRPFHGSNKCLKQYTLVKTRQRTAHDGGRRVRN